MTARYIEEISSTNNTFNEKPSFWINDNRILLSILFGISGIIFFVLFLDSHYKTLINTKHIDIQNAQFGKAIKERFGKILKE
jgi:succinate dehydrogenase/fumarate reductase cytochrome b subunit